MEEYELDERLSGAVTLLVAVCEQLTQELEQLQSPPMPLLNRLQETHDLAIDFARSASAE